MTQRLTPEMLVDRIRVFEVDELHDWDRNPNQGDVGAIARSMGEFGQLDVLLVSNGVIRAGNHRVRAERANREFGGRLAGIDITDLDWDDATLDAASIALNQTARLSLDDPGRLALLLLEINDRSEDLLTATGFDPDDLDRLVADLLRDTNPALAAALDASNSPLTAEETIHDEPNVTWNPTARAYDLPTAVWTENDEGLPTLTPVPNPTVTFAVAVPKNLRHSLTRRLKQLMNETATMTMGEALAAHFQLEPAD